ncbi:MAG: hypothetical protein JSS49_23190 [Planctomycetes bacterium]|nr:hypothetical protein [Planctomycetota bacterium]
MHRAALFLARFCSSAWIGAATLFVVVGILEVTRGGLDSTTKDILVALRFPPFYVTGFLLAGLAWLGACVAEFHVELPRRRRAFAILSLVAVLALLFVDYHWIYGPLESMVKPPGQAKPSSFVAYHEASKWINLVGLVFAWTAAVALNWPSRPCDE